MKFRVKANPQGQVYFPKVFRDEFGNEYDVISNISAAVLYPSKADLRKVKLSMEILIHSIEHRIQAGEGQWENSTKS